MITKTDIEKYFVAEKQESLLFICIGIAAIIVAVIGLLIWKTQFWKGAAIPLLLVAVIQIIVGYTVYARSDADRTKMVYALDMNPSNLTTKEIPRMQTVNKKFIAYRYIEIALLIIAIALIILYKSNMQKQLLFGIGVGLVIQAAIMLTADFFAEKRAIIYTQQLKTLQQ